MLENKEITTYEIWYPSAPMNGAIAMIWCLNNGLQIGTIFFAPDGTVLPADTIQPQGGTDLLMVWYYMSQFNDIVNILRLDKRVSIFVKTPPGNAYGGITTWPEKIGAEEGV